MELSKKDRLMLWNQYEILKILKKDDEYEIKNYEYFQEILLNGYKQNYTDMIEWVMDDLPDSVSSFVWDVLQMYSVLLISYNALSPDEKNGIDVNDITYQGFDGNEESAYLSYAGFIFEKMERYQEIYNKIKDLNSHWPVLDKYSLMLDTWKSVRFDEYQPLTREQLLQVISDK